MPGLFDPIRLRGVEARNRVWIAPMCQYSVEARDGVPTDWHLAHLGSFAIGGAGVVMAEATAVVAEGRISPEDTGIWGDEHVAGWRRVTAFLRAQGAVPAVQLAHAGRKASTYGAFADASGSVPEADGGWQAVAPSPVAFDGYAEPRELTLDEVRAMPAVWAAAARRALDAGFELLEIHAAHGYLLHEFLSPRSNRRGDEYGGDLAGRSRLLVEIVRAVRAEVGDDVPLLVRFSATDWADAADGPSWDLEQTVAASRLVVDAGADLVDVSSGGLLAGARVPVGLGYQVPFAERIRSEAGVPVDAVGLVVEPRQAAEIVEQGRADAIMLGRAALRDPHWALRAAHELGAQIPWRPQYRRAAPGPGIPW